MVIKSFLETTALIFLTCCVAAGVPDGTPTERPDAASIAKDTDAYEAIELFTEVMMHVHRNYVDEKSYEEIIHGALDGMLHSLDPHSDFMEPREYKNLKEDTEGRYGGIGIHISMREGVLTIIAPIEDTPGFRAGLQSGDRIIEIDGETTSGLTLQQAVDKMRGPEGEEIVIAVQPMGDTATRTITIIREKITISTVKGARLLDSGIGYVRVTQFSEPTAELLEKELVELADEGMRALVIDLRSNPGGLLTSAVDVSELFLGRGDLVVTTKGRTSALAGIPRIATRYPPFADVPVAVLVNRWSASASEIVAGALRDHRRAILVGETTYGKGSVQSIIKCQSEKNAACRMTTAYYYTPGDHLIHKKGIEPDIPVYVSAEEWRDVLRARLRDESPELYSDEEKSDIEDVADRAFRRAVDLLQALLILGGEA